MSQRSLFNHSLGNILFEAIRYLYNGYIYSYIFLGFGNLGNEIQLFRYDLEDLCRLLNSSSE